MTQIHVDPDALDAFADSLVKFRSSVVDEANLISSRLRHLGDSWADQEYDRFSDEMTSTMRMIDEFCTQLDAVLPGLRQDATDIRAYLAHSV